MGRTMGASLVSHLVDEPQAAAHGDALNAVRAAIAEADETDARFLEEVAALLAPLRPRALDPVTT